MGRTRGRGEESGPAPPGSRGPTSVSGRAGRGGGGSRRRLPPARTAAKKSSAARPYFKVEAIDRQANIRRLRWSTWYSGAEPEGPHAVAVPTDGSLNRLRGAGTPVPPQR